MSPPVSPAETVTDLSLRHRGELPQFASTKPMRQFRAVANVLNRRDRRGAAMQRRMSWLPK
jgi:hypothetical protein